MQFTLSTAIFYLFCWSAGYRLGLLYYRQLGVWGKYRGMYYLSGRDNTDMKVIKLIVIPWKDEEDGPTPGWAPSYLVLYTLALSFLVLYCTLAPSFLVLYTLYPSFLVLLTLAPSFLVLNTLAGHQTHSHPMKGWRGRSHCGLQAILYCTRWLQAFLYCTRWL